MKKKATKRVSTTPPGRIDISNHSNSQVVKALAMAAAKAEAADRVRRGLTRVVCKELTIEQARGYLEPNGFGRVREVTIETECGFFFNVMLDITITRIKGRSVLYAYRYNRTYPNCPALVSIKAIRRTANSSSGSKSNNTPRRGERNTDLSRRTNRLPSPSAART